MAGYCEVALPVPLRKTFTYSVPDGLGPALAPGARVVVPFRNRALVGVVVACGGQPAEAAPTRDVAEVLDMVPALPPRVLELGRWLAGYYLAPIGETLRAMLPPPVELRIKRECRLTEAGCARLRELTSLTERTQAQEAELAVLRTVGEQRADGSGGRLPGEAAGLLRQGLLAFQEIAIRRRRRMQRIVAWRDAGGEAPVRPTEARVHHVLSEERGPLPLKRLLQIAGVSRAVVDRLVRSGRVEIWDEPVADEEPLESEFTPPSNALNEEQRRAVGEIETWLESRQFVVGLLYGVTGSGKTEVYLRAVEAVLERGRTALLLVPEIALTLWLGRLCRAKFGAGVAVLHSGLPDLERAREWRRARTGDARVVVGTRSAVFAPLENVGVIIVDEEQEASYKQEETPRYHGRDVAIMRAKLEGAVALLGSATPSLESFYHTRAGKYRLLRLDARVENRPLARVAVVDLREEFRRTQRARPVSERLRAALADRLAAGTQSLVLINRRGYSWFALCRSCGAAVLCDHCSIALTYHKRHGRLECHYCGFSRPVPKACPKCSSEHVYFVGAGAEQVEEHLQALFPDARVARLDRDAARTRRAFERVLGAFAAGKVDILVGTQMVAKGHDFQRVTLVGVVSADAQLAFPDFRAAERTFQLLTQVAGRAGRGRLPGEVLVETHYPEHYAIEMAARQDYLSFFEKELHFRKLMHYPPFTVLANLLIRDAKVEQAIRWSRQIGDFLHCGEARGIRVLGPAAAPLARLKREYRFQFLLKSPRRSTLNRLLSQCLEFAAGQGIPERALLLDVDPVSLL